MTTMFQNPTHVTGGFDIGARSVKMAILSHSGAASAVVAKAVVTIPGSRDGHDARAAIRESWRRLLTETNLSARDVDNMASTGTGARQVVRVGHLFRHSLHGLGARLLFPDATVALDIAGNQIRCVLLKDPRGARTQSECGDQPLGKLARRAMVDLDEPPAPSPGAPLPECIVTRAAILLRSLAAGGKVVLTGEMVLDTGFVQRLWSRLLALQSNVSLLISPDAVFAGAYGAAILASRRFTRISRSFDPAFTDPTVAALGNGTDRTLN